MLVLLVHFGYPFVSETAIDAKWNFYIARGIEGTILFAILWAVMPRHVLMSLACCLGAAEEAQTALCGSLGRVDVPLYSGLCIEQFGPLPSAAVAAAAFVFIIWRLRNDPTK